WRRRAPSGPSLARRWRRRRRGHGLGRWACRRGRRSSRRRGRRRRGRRVGRRCGRGRRLGLRVADRPGINAMTRHIPMETAVLDLEAWEAPDHLTRDEFYLEAGGDLHPVEAFEREDER